MHGEHIRSKFPVGIKMSEQTRSQLQIMIKCFEGRVSRGKHRGECGQRKYFG